MLKNYDDILENYNKNKIPEFVGQYEFLSNFYLCDVFYNKHKYPSVEHAYQSAKSTSLSWKYKCSQNIYPGIIKKESRNVELIPNWNQLRVGIMMECVRSKFTTNVNLQKMLLDTKDAYLEEGNWWNDKFWGYCLKTNTGQNVLGKILMNIREELLFSI